MIIRYVHSCAPEVQKTYNTNASLRGSLGLIHAMGLEITQAQWDKRELDRFESDKISGVILEYDIVQKEDL